MKKLFLRVISLLVTGAIIVILLYKPDWTYLACEAAKEISSQAKVEETSSRAMNLKKYEMRDLKKDKRISYDQSLMLINQENRLSKSFKPDLVQDKSGNTVMNQCLVKAYTLLKSDIQENGQDPLHIKCAYRNKQKQREMIAQYGDVATSVGASEHQAGLALDICSQGFGGKSFIKGGTGQYVNSNCWKCGFIIRYPYYGKSETGIDYEPWHIRYVGVPHAEIMYKNQMTMESYISSLKIGTYYKYHGYLILKQEQKQQSIYLPEHFKSGVISSDNKGNYIVTLKY